MLALGGCLITRSLDGNVEVVEASATHRVFPTRVTESLGLCVKYGPDHRVRVDGKDLLYPENSLCVRRPGCVWSTLGTGPVGFLSLDIGAPLLPRGLLLQPMAFSAPRAAPELAAYARAVATADSEGTSEMVCSLLARLESAGLLSAEDFRESVPGSLAVRAREALEAAVALPPSLVRLSAELGINRFALMRAFKRAFGITPHAFVLRLRVERARERIARGAHVTDLAFELGFADQPHFCRTFKSVTGVTPGQYARSTRGRAVLVTRTFIQER